MFLLTAVGVAGGLQNEVAVWGAGVAGLQNELGDSETWLWARSVTEMQKLDRKDFFVNSVINEYGAVDQLAYPRPFADDSPQPGETPQ